MTTRRRRVAATGRHTVPSTAPTGRARLLAAGVALAAAAGLAVGGAAMSSAHEQPSWGAGGGGKNVVTVPVSFTVTLQNRTGVPCVETPPASGTEVVRGHITGPAYQVNSPLTQGTLYLHGNGYDENFWNYDKNPAYNYTADMARRDHVSVTVDRLGYGQSDKPNGKSLCLNTEADVASQIVDQLRAGTYQGSQRPKLNKVGIVGHSASGFVVEQEAVSFHNVDAVGVVSSGTAAMTPLVGIRAGQQQMRCLSSPDGYAGLEANDAEFRSDHIAPNTDPAIAADLTKRRTRDACAGTLNLQSILTHPITNSGINVPVLSIAGTEDMFFPNNQNEAATYTGSPKVTVNKVPTAGHSIAFGRSAPIFRDDVNAWLTANKL